VNLGDRARSSRPEFVFHLHRFDDNDRLSNHDCVTGPNQHPYELAGHRRRYPLGAPVSGSAIGRVGSSASTASIERDRDCNAIDDYRELSGCSIDGDDRIFGRRAVQNQRQRLRVDSRDIDLFGSPIDRHCKA
jgi:hypothetical protein